jgi:hypothetical protein
MGSPEEARAVSALREIGIRDDAANTSSQPRSAVENEFYGKIRPKRRIRTGERPLYARRQRGVEYVEVRLMDLVRSRRSASPRRRAPARCLPAALLPRGRPIRRKATPSRNQERVAARGRERAAPRGAAPGCFGIGARVVDHARWSPPPWITRLGRARPPRGATKH